MSEDVTALITRLGVELGVGDSDGEGWEIQQNPEEFAELVAFCQSHDVRTVLELGTGYTGGLARFMAEHLGWLVTSVDINIPTFHPVDGVEFIQGTTDAVYPFLQHRLFDLVLIDACHSYKSVKADHEHYAHMGRIVALHDIAPGRECCAGTVQYWREIQSDHEHAFETIGKHKPAGIGWYLNPKQHAKTPYFEATCDPLPDKTPDITVVTGTYNRLELLQKMVVSARASVPTGVILDFVLVDNGSTDGTAAWIETQPDCTLVQMGALVGANRALTEGAKRATGRYVLTGNDDIEFVGGALFEALCYLERHLDAGGVAMAFTRPNKPDYHINTQPAVRDGKHISIHYAQIGLIRRELGNEAGWWGADDATFGAWSYGGDNYLTSRLYEMGRPVHPLMTARFKDRLPEDELRQKTKAVLKARPQTDQDCYYTRWGDGAIYNAQPTQHQPAEALRILYAPIYADDNPRLYQERVAWRKSLEKMGICVEFDYRGVVRRQGAGVMRRALSQLVNAFKPHVLFTQVHTTHDMDADTLISLRNTHPGMVVVNYNADENSRLARDKDAVRYMQHVDLQLVVNLSMCAWLSPLCVRTAYVPQATEIVAPDLSQKAHDVAYLGMAYTAYGAKGESDRARMERELRGALPDVDFGFYGDGWQRSAGNNHHHWSAQYGVYHNAKLAIVDNMYYDRAYAYVSERLYNAMKFGQCVLWRGVRGCETFLGFEPWVHYIPWGDFGELADRIREYLSPERDAERLAIGSRAREFARKHHNYDVRTRWMFDQIAQLAKG